MALQASIPGLAARPRDMRIGSPVLRLARLAVYLGLTLPAMAAQLVFLLLGWKRGAESFPVRYHGWCCAILGIDLAVIGPASTHRPTLFVANHASYLDITILGALIPGSFVAKAEVASWPLFGWLAKLQRTVFIDRRRRSTALQRDSMAGRIHAGDNLILFPEGTSGDGNRVLPFKTPLFAAAAAPDESLTVMVQPVSVCYARLDGMPLGRLYRPFFAWYGNMDLFPHLWRMAGIGRLGVTVIFHPPVRLADFGTRKALARYCEGVVAAGLAAALAGREASHTAAAKGAENTAAAGA